MTIGALGVRREGLVLRGRMRGRISRRARVPRALRDFYHSDFRGRFSFEQVTGTGAVVGSGRGARLRASGTFPLPRLGRTVGRFAVAAGTGKRRAMNAECRALSREMPRPRLRSRSRG